MRCQSIDEKVQESFCGEDVEMEERRNVSFGHIERTDLSGVSNTERCSVWGYVRRMGPNTPVKESEAWKADGKSSFRSQSRLPDSPIGDLELSATGLATPPPLLYTRKPVLRRKGGAPDATAKTEGFSQPSDDLKLKPDNGLTPSEQCDAESPLGGGESGTCAKKGSHRLLRKVFQPRRNDSMKDGIGDWKTFLAGATNTSSPLCSGPKPRVGDPASTDRTEP